MGKPISRLLLDQDRYNLIDSSRNHVTTREQKQPNEHSNSEQETSFRRTCFLHVTPAHRGTPYACSSSLIAGELVLLSFDKSAEDIHRSFHLIFISLPYNRGMHILIVEDEAKIRHFLRRGLLEESYAVDTAEDGEEALYKLDIHAYDLVLLDILLPKVNGLAVCQALREKGSHVPIIPVGNSRPAVDSVPLS